MLLPTFPEMMRIAPVRRIASLFGPQSCENPGVPAEQTFVGRV
jgi:hypothetical protein